MATLYHGTSSRFISNIIKNGLGVLDTVGKYAEIRNILSKYIKPDILTDEFFDKYAGFIDSGTVSTIGLRNIQSIEGKGPFAVIEDNSIFGDTKYSVAPEYAKATTDWGAGEFEYGIVRFLNTIQQRLNYLESNDNNSPDYRKFLKLLKDNAKLKYISSDGNLNFYTDGNYETDFPILIKIEVADNEIANRYTIDARTKNVVTPEQIKGIAFLPPFYYRGTSSLDVIVPDLKFLSKEEFLRELSRREGKRHWNETFETKDKDGNTKYMFLFPTYDIACVQNFVDGDIYKSSFFDRAGHINKGKIAEKHYKHGKPCECVFYENGGITKRVIFENGKPAECIFFNEQGVFLDKDEFFIGKDGKYHLAVWPNKLTKKQMFILNYEKQPQKMSDKAKTAYIEEKKKEIKSRLKDGAGVLTKRTMSREKTELMFGAYKSAGKVN